MQDANRLTRNANALEAGRFHGVKRRFLDRGVIPRAFVGDSIESISQVPSRMKVRNKVRS